MCDRFDTCWREGARLARILFPGAPVGRSRPNLSQEALLAGVLCRRTPTRAHAFTRAADVGILACALDTVARRNLGQFWYFCTKNQRLREKPQLGKKAESGRVVAGGVVVGGRGDVKLSTHLADCCSFVVGAVIRMPVILGSPLGQTTRLDLSICLQVHTPVRTIL